MGHIFRIECQKCEQNMRFDAKHHRLFGEMVWHCWKCWYGIKTLDLNRTVVQVYDNFGEEEE